MEYWIAPPPAPHLPDPGYRGHRHNVDHPRVVGDEYVLKITNRLRRLWCWLFHRRHWEWLTWGGLNFHHMQHCNECGEDWPERPNVPNKPRPIPPPPVKRS